MKTGPRSRIWQNVAESKIVLRNETIVSFNLLQTYNADTPVIYTILEHLQTDGSCLHSIGKKLKRRLEDLERRAASSASPEQSHAEPVPPKSASNKSRAKSRAMKSVDTKPHMSHAAPPERPASYDYYSTPDERAMFAQQCTRQLSASPPPAFSYPPLPTYDGYRPTYGQVPVYHTVPSSYHEMSFSAEYGDHVSSILPMVPSQAMGAPRKPTYDEDIISPFSMSYASMAGIDLCPQPSHPEPSLPVHFPR